ncbi:hypothetical protein Tco_0228416 [Tanacetum coccineum]
MALPRGGKTKKWGILLLNSHKDDDARKMWDAIKSRFGRNEESKKMQKYILKQQFKGFSVSNTKGLHKGYDRFQSLLSQLEIHGAGVSTEDANQKFLRSLPSAWSQVSLIMMTFNPGVDSLCFDDLYYNLRVFVGVMYKGSTAYPLARKNVAICLLRTQLKIIDLEEIDFEVASGGGRGWPMISMRMKSFYMKALYHESAKIREIKHQEEGNAWIRETKRWGAELERKRTL